MTTILYLEDEKNIREVTLAYLESEKYVVQCATDGKQALKLLETQTFDLAILDILVPYHSGLEVLLKINEKSPNTKCIMLSALDDEKTQIDAFELYADDYIIKPFSPRLLLKRIEAVLRRSDIKQVKQGLQLHPDSYQAFYNQVNLNLTVTEYILLETLMTQAHKVYKRSELLDSIDPDNLSVSDRVIDAHIKNLRKKLPTDMIKTVIGLGYQFQGVNHETV